MAGPRHRVLGQPAERRREASARSIRSRRRGVRSPASVATRVRVWWCAVDLDRQLAAGTHPWKSRALALRAAQLTHRDQQARFARELDWILSQAAVECHDPRRVVVLQRTAILSGAEDLRELAAALRSPSRCGPRAAGLISYLLHDGCSPLYDDHAAASVAGVARAASAGFRPADGDDA